MQINNHQIVDYDAVLDAKFGAEGQAELARRIGSDRSYISRVESGQTEPKVSTFYRIMNALGCKIEFSKIL